MRFVESDIVELKRSFSPDIERTIEAFANNLGDTLYIGIPDDGTVVGVDNVDFIMQQIFNSIRDEIRRIFQ